MPRDPYSRGLPGHIVSLFFLTLSSIAFKEMRLGTASFATHAPMEKIVTYLKFENDHTLRTEYSGNRWVDLGTRYLVAAFLPGVAGWDKGFQIQQLYFLFSFFPILAIWSVEAGRRRNIMAWTSFTSLWALFYQTVGGAVIIPLYYLSYMRESRSSSYWSPQSRPVPASYAKMVLPALVCGYLIPTAAMYYPWSDPELSFTQSLIALWQISPLLVNMLLFNPATFQSEAQSTPSSPVTTDIPYLKLVYIFSFLVAAAAHIGALFVTLTSTVPELQIGSALGLVKVSEDMGFAEALHYIFQVDFHIIFAAALVGAFVQFWDLRRAGKTDVSLFKVFLYMAVGTVGVGPAATVAAVWYVREGIMAGKEKV